MYKKLEQNFINPNFTDWASLKSDINTATFLGKDKKSALEYFMPSDADKLLKIYTRRFCKIPPTVTLYSTITGSGSIGPHIDHGPLAGLNFYVSAGVDETVFYKKKNKDAAGLQYPGREQSNIFSPDDIDEVDKFVANSNEAYLLDVSKIHSVRKLTNEPRIFIAHLWYEHSYEEVLENLI